MIVFSLGGWCRQIQTGFLRSRPTQGSRPDKMLARTGLSPCAAGLPMPFRFASLSVMRALQPRTPRKAPGLGSAPFARRYLGYHCCFLFLRVLRCFSSPRSPPQFVGIICLHMMGCPIRKSADRWPFAPPRGLSQLVTSFFAVKSQGIPCAPFVTYSILLVVSLRPHHPPCCSQHGRQRGLRFLRSCFSPSSLSKNFAEGLSLPAWRMTDSNRRPPACKAGALAS